MISETQAKKYCSESLELIENYEQAVSDKEHQWDCHHRGEILPCGTYSPSDLKKFGLYWKRPASELIFLTKAEHNRLHKKGNTNWLGRKHSAETKRKIGEAGKGRKHTEESIRKMAEARRRYYASRRAKA